MTFRLPCVVAVLLVACSEGRPVATMPVCPPAAPTTPTAAAAAPLAASTPPAASPPPSPTVAPVEGDALERLYPGSDSARIEGPKKRHANAVLLFSPPRSPDIEPLARIDTLAFQPVLCTIGGRLQAGLRCGEIMPRRVTVRLTSTSSGDDTMEVTRSTAPFVATPEDGPITYPPPYGPACCNYKACNGKTIPYRPVEKSGYAFATTKTILAVWPADADLDLDPKTPETDAQTARTWKLDVVGPRKLLQIATSDVDHDGKPETLVYAWWANDYGLDVFVAGTAAPIHGVHCGNI